MYWWGLEMFQPKWIGGQAALDRVAGLAAAARYGGAPDADKVAQELRSAGYPDLADAVLSKYVAQARADVLRRPWSGVARWQLAAILRDAGGASGPSAAPGLGAALREYRAAASLLPNAPEVLDDNGGALDQRGRTADAITQYRRAVALDPCFAKAFYDLGWDLKQTGRQDEARRDMQRSVLLYPENPDVYDALGRLLMVQGQYSAAMVALRECLALSPSNADAATMLCSALDSAGQYGASLAAGRTAVSLNPQDGDSHDNMADDDLHLKVWDASLQESQAALAINGADAVAQENIAEAYWGQGRGAEARAQWERVAALGDPHVTPVARHFLAQHP